MKKSKFKSYILWFNEIGIDDIELVGGKNASLGEMHNNLKRKKIQVPPGFAITVYAYKHILEKSGGFNSLREVLSQLNHKDTNSLAFIGEKAREIILNCEIPSDLQNEIVDAYHNLSSQYKLKNIDVAIRSSATSEDLPTASFAGQQETYLNISGEKEVIAACKQCFASLFTNRAIAYRCEQKIDHLSSYLSIGVQKMIRSDLASAGVIFTLDTESGFQNVVYVTGSYGLGESIVQGTVNPDEFYVFKPTLKQGYKPIINKIIGEKAVKIVYLKNITKTIDTPLEDRKKFCINDEEVLQLAKWAIDIEDHYSKKNKKWTPMDIEWAKDGETNQLYIVQARPETVQSQKNQNIINEYILTQKSSIITTGKSVGNKIATGVARVINNIKEMDQFKHGEILVTDKTDPDWMPIMRIASAIVTNRGGRTSHAAIVSRELGLSCVVGTTNATSLIKNGEPITVDCSGGEVGVIYNGLLEFKINTIDVQKIPSPKTKIMLNVSYPDEAFALSLLPSDGVGLAREEFIINECIRIHPMALIKFEEVKDLQIIEQINLLTFGYSDKSQFFVDKLAMGVATIAAAFHPRDVILRFSDFKTNEYINLIGGKYFEPKEENPMIGWRGASRYYKDGYKEGFALECKAIKKVREEFGLKNLKVMIPMCRTPKEGEKVIQAMKKNGLVKGKNDLEVYVMCEIPSNVILVDQFCDIFDGFSIGSNDLTQMILGVDRDNELIADIYDERSDAVKRMIEHVIRIAKAKNRKIGICGDAPSTYPEFAKFLVDCGIDSISLSADALIKTRIIIANHEAKG